MSETYFRIDQYLPDDAPFTVVMEYANEHYDVDGVESYVQDAKDALASYKSQRKAFEEERQPQIDAAFDAYATENNKLCDLLKTKRICLLAAIAGIVIGVIIQLAAGTQGAAGLLSNLLGIVGILALFAWIALVVVAKVKEHVVYNREIEYIEIVQTTVGQVGTLRKNLIKACSDVYDGIDKLYLDSLDLQTREIVLTRRELKDANSKSQEALKKMHSQLEAQRAETSAVESKLRTISNQIDRKFSNR